MLCDLISQVKENMQKKGKSAKEIAITLYCIRERYKNDEVFNPHVGVLPTPPIKEPTREERILALQQHYKEKGERTGHWVFSPSSIKKECSISKFGQTELHIAVAQENRRAIRKLIESGVDYSARDNSGYTAYQHALMNGDKKTVQLFKELGITK